MDEYGVGGGPKARQATGCSRYSLCCCLLPRPHAPNPPLAGDGERPLLLLFEGMPADQLGDVVWRWNTALTRPAPATSIGCRPGCNPTFAASMNALATERPTSTAAARGR